MPPKDHKTMKKISLYTQTEKKITFIYFSLLQYPTMSMIQIGCLLVGQTLNITILSFFRSAVALRVFFFASCGL